MFKNTNKILNFLKAIIFGNTRLCASLPTPCEVLIIDSAAKNEIAQVLLTGYRWQSLDIRLSHGNEFGVFYVHPAIIIRIIRFMLQGFPLGTSYMLSIVAAVKPKAVIEFVHLNHFIDLANAFKDIKFITILVGVFNDPINHEIYSPMLHQVLGKRKIHSLGNYSIYCVGQKDIDLFSAYGVSESKTGIKFYAAGPFLGGYYLNQAIPSNSTCQVDYDICLASSVGVSHLTHDSPFLQIQMECNDLLCEYLAKFIKESNLRFVIAPRTRESGANHEIEYDYFRKWFGTDVKIIPREDLFSTYRLMRRSRVAIAQSSSSLWEALFWKQKVMFCPFHLSNVFRHSIPPKYASNQEMWKWWLDEPDYEKFKMLLLDLLNLSDEQYWLQAHNTAEYAVSYGSVPSYQRIGDAIRLAVGR